jgi:hypothetical protein
MAPAQTDPNVASESSSAPGVCPPPIPPLRRRMIDDMTIRNMSPNTQKIYIRAVANFSAYHGQSPDKLTFEDVRDYQLHLASCRLKVSWTNVIMCGLRFFYGTTRGKLNVSKHIPIDGRHLR